MADPCRHVTAAPSDPCESLRPLVGGAPNGIGTRNHRRCVTSTQPVFRTSRSASSSRSLLHGTAAGRPDAITAWVSTRLFSLSVCSKALIVSLASPGRLREQTQSLGDIASQAAQQSGTTQPAKVYRNADLKPAEGNAT